MILNNDLVLKGEPKFYVTFVVCAYVHEAPDGTSSDDCWPFVLGELESDKF